MNDQERSKDAAVEVPALVDGKELRIAGLQEHYTLETRGGIPEQWRRFNRLLETIAGWAAAAAYGVCWNNDPKYGFDYLTGVEIADDSPLPVPLRRLHLPPQRYAVYLHHGPIAEIGATFKTIWTRRLPTSGLQPAPGPCVERYDERFNAQTGRGIVEIWIPVHR